MRLFNHLELTGINDHPGLVTKLVNVNTPVKISKGNIDFWGNSSKIKNLFTNKIINLERVELIEAFLKFEIDRTNSRVRIKTHIFYSRIS